MSVSIEEDASSPFSDGQSALDQTVSKSSSHDSLENSSKSQNDEATPNSSKTKPSSPKVHPMAFTIDFGEGKQVDKSRLEELAKKSKARHQRIQSMSATLTRPNPVDTKPPISAKLPRKAQGYNSEGYFSSDQEDSCLSGSVKLRQSPLAQFLDKSQNGSSPNAQRNFRSPINEPVQFRRVSKSPIVDSIMSRSDILPSRQSLNLPLRNTNSSYLRDVHRTPSYGNLSSSFQPRSVMPDIVNQSPDPVMLTDISSPELDILTPDNGLSTPELRSPIQKVRAQSETPDMLYKKCTPTNEVLFIDDEVDRESNNSSTGTYTIEGDNYTEEQKARMSIDRKIGMDMLTDSMKDNIKKRGISAEKDPELVFDHSIDDLKSSQKLRSPLTSQETFDLPSKATKDKNVLEISCTYESPAENDLATQTSKQIKSTRNYLEKIKNRVRTITEKTFSKHAEDQDLGNFTSVTTSGVLSSKHPPRHEFHSRRRCSLTKSEIDQTDYIHRLTRESSVPVSLNVKPAFEEPKFESTPLRNAHKILRSEEKNGGDLSQTGVVGKLSHLSLNRCKGDKTWIQDWADSVKEYNNNTLAKETVVNNFMADVERLPLSPRWEVASKCSPRTPHCGTSTKIPSPVDMRRMTPDLIPTPLDTDAYLQKTQNAITNLQAKLNSSRTNTNPSPLTTSLNDKSRLPVSQLSRSNSLNYRLRRKPGPEIGSPLRCPGNYVIMGSGSVPESTRKLLNSASKSLDTERKNLSPGSERVSSNSTIALSNITQHLNRPKNEYLTDNAVTKPNNNRGIDLTRLQGDPKGHQRVFSDGIDKTIAFGSSMRRSSSFNTVRHNNNYIDSGRIGNPENSPDLRYRKQLARRIESSDLKSNAPAKCPNTPEMPRKFGPGLVRNSCRLTNKERPGNSRMSEPPIGREERGKPTNHHSRRVSEPRQVTANRLTKSRSSTREFQPKGLEKGKPSQHRSSSALAAKEQEFSNWKKRATYDPRKAAQEGKRKQQARREGELSSPSHSSPVHRSQSYHTSTELADYSSEGTDDDVTLDPMVTSTQSDRVWGCGVGGVGGEGVDLRRHAMSRDVLCRDYVAGFTINQPTTDTLKRRTNEDKRKTFILDDVTPTRETVELLRSDGVDKRKTFILDSDTNSTTNGSSPRNSSIFSHPHQSLTVNTSDTEGESEYRNPKHRYSGDYSMSSSTTSITQPKKKDIQPRYMDISKYKNDNSPKVFLRRDPSKTYVGVLNHEPSVSKGSAHHYELEQKKQELEKWKRRASYDPRKSAAMAKTKTQPKTGSNVLRSQSFHGPVLGSTSLRYQPESDIVENYDASSDNDF